MTRLFIILLSILFTGCYKETDRPEPKKYYITCMAHHNWNQVNELGTGMGEASFGFTILDEYNHLIWEKTGYIQNQTLYFDAIGSSGQYLTMYVSVTDVWDYASATIEINGQLEGFISTNDQFINQSAGFYFKNINGKEFLVKEIKLS
jgi:hypothetical protein